MQVLIVDDNRDFRALMRKTVQEAGHQPASATCAKEALDALDAGPVDLVLLDYRLPGLNGLETLKEIKKQYPRLDIVMLTSYGTIPMAVEAIKQGATDYLSKPVDPNELRKVLEQVARRRELEEENRRLRGLLDERYGLKSIKGSSPPIKQLREQIRRLADSDVPVLITGESGTGKELAARAIHLLSRRCEYPFVAVNCPALPSALAESELFGHVKGAFTGADRNRRGQFVSASTGTLFLDEIGDMPLELQAKVLRAIETSRIRPVGSEKEHDLDLRYLFATNRDLQEMVAAGDFRQDLFYRINVVHINIPPLREHPEDIPELIENFFKGRAGNAGVHLTTRAMRAMERYPWPGNVRELEHALERALILGGGDEIDIDDLPPSVVRTGAAFTFTPVIRDGMAQSDRFPLLTLEELEMIAVMKTLEATGGDKSRAARILGINRATLYRKINKFDLSDWADGTTPDKEKPAEKTGSRKSRRKSSQKSTKKSAKKSTPKPGGNAGGKSRSKKHRKPGK